MAITALAKGLELLSCFTATKPEWSVTELSAHLRLYKSRVHRILDTLAETGFVERDAVTMRYRLGAGARRLSSAAEMTSDAILIAVAQPYLTELRDRTKGSIHIRAIRDGTNVIIQTLDSPLPLRLVRPVGERAPMHFGASGKALLAFAPESVRDLALRNDLSKPFARRTIVKADEFLRELKKVRRLGYAFTDEEAIDGVRSVAAPILSRGGFALAAVTSALPAAKLHDRMVPIHGRAVMDCAARISEAISNEVAASKQMSMPRLNSGGRT